MKAIAVSLAISIPLALVLILLSWGTLLASPSKTQICTVSPGAECSISFNLLKGDEVSGLITIKSNSSDATHFWVTDPKGASIYDGGNVNDRASFLFSAGAKGAYLLHFDSSLPSLVAKLVTLNYTVNVATEC